MFLLKKRKIPFLPLSETGSVGDRKQLKKLQLLTNLSLLNCINFRWSTCCHFIGHYEV